MCCGVVLMQLVVVYHIGNMLACFRLSLLFQILAQRPLIFYYFASYSAGLSCEPCLR